MRSFRSLTSVAWLAAGLTACSMADAPTLGYVDHRAQVATPVKVLIIDSGYLASGGLPTIDAAHNLSCDGVSLDGSVVHGSSVFAAFWQAAGTSLAEPYFAAIGPPETDVNTLARRT